jgi:hypothetical protein
MTYEIRLEHVAARPLAVVRRRATIMELGRVVPEACGIVWNALRTHKVAGAGRHVAVYLDSVMNLEVGVELVAALAAPVGEVVPSALPAGDVATTTHFGPYQGLAAAHHAIHRWCEANHREPIRPCWEIYGHWEEAWNKNPALIRTDVYYLLKPR